MMSRSQLGGISEAVTDAFHRQGVSSRVEGVVKGQGGIVKLNGSLSGSALVRYGSDMFESYMSRMRGQFATLELLNMAMKHLGYPKHGGGSNRPRFFARHLAALVTVTSS